MKPITLFTLVLVAGALLTACSRTAVGPSPLLVEQVAPEALIADAPEHALPGVADEEDIGAPASGRATGWPDGEVRLDDQGFVEVAVTPLNLNAAAETLDFSVGLNTHSVDLSMDLASLAFLEADNGLRVDPIGWDGPGGGHHVSGTLSFPATVDGARLLEKTAQLTLTVRDVDAPQRLFQWSLSG